MYKYVDMRMYIIVARQKIVAFLCSQFLVSWIKIIKSHICVHQRVWYSTFQMMHIMIKRIADVIVLWNSWYMVITVACQQNQALTWTRDVLLSKWTFNSSPPEQNGHHCADDILDAFFSWMKLFCISFKISLKSVPKDPTGNNSALVWIIDLRRIADKPLSEPILAWFTDSLTHICDTGGGADSLTHICNTGGGGGGGEMR